ncbi:MAG: hypothetical protein BGN96_17045 [Bacteroidales bacterium 45-6]|nr:MAG: hypothetical protein BGN96_17045 [Bacteroidales bacterium 45-6]
MVKVAVVGATGAVGREMLKTLSERNFPAKQVVALASEQSSGKQVSFGEEKLLTIQPLTHYDFHGTDIALFSAGSQRSKEFAPKAAAAGCYVVDNSSYFRMHQDVTLIVPEVNGNNLQSTQSKIIANPNCVAIPLVMVLKALESLASIERAVVSTYQSVSGKGRKAMDELFRQTKAVMVGDAIAKEEFPKQIAFNLFPHIDTFREDGITFEEIGAILSRRYGVPVRFENEALKKCKIRASFSGTEPLDHVASVLSAIRNGSFEQITDGTIVFTGEGCN